jgi:hypothetical protein
MTTLTAIERARPLLLLAFCLALTSACEKESQPAESTPATSAPVTSESGETTEEAADDGPEVAAPKEIERDPPPKPESPPELSDDILAALCEGADNVDTSGEFPACKECPFAAATRYNTAWEMYYAFEGSFSRKRAKELFVSGPGCYDADGNHAAALVQVSGKPKVIGAIRSTKADLCKSFDWFGRNAVACISDYEKRGQVRKIVTFFEVLDNKLKDLRMLDLPFKDGLCNFEGIYRRDLKNFDAVAEGKGAKRVVRVVLEFEAKVGSRKSGTPGDCMAIANGEVEVESVPEV